jgi:hypothetical protein
MFGFQKDKERDRYYLLPGMGGRAYRRKQMTTLKAAIVIGVVVSVVFACILYLIHRVPD